MKKHKKVTMPAMIMKNMKTVTFPFIFSSQNLTNEEFLKKMSKTLLKLFYWFRNWNWISSKNIDFLLHLLNFSAFSGAMTIARWAFQAKTCC
jgi:hypothetical protein